MYVWDWRLWVCGRSANATRCRVYFRAIDAVAMGTYTESRSSVEAIAGYVRMRKKRVLAYLFAGATALVAVAGLGTMYFVSTHDIYFHDTYFEFKVPDFFLSNP
ncbi:MAG: hypothetical protein AMXMBFR84_17910 [Candidatus Hydrogenedentota bacterium]